MKILTHKAAFENLPKQTFLVEEGKVGDCWRCCVAAILGIPALGIPHFVMQSEMSSEAYTQRWLAVRNFLLISARGKFQIPMMHRDPIVKLPIISCGPSPRSKRIGQHHAVVYLDNEMVYDPHPSEAGLTAITEEYMIVGV